MTDVAAQTEDLIETPLRTNEFRRFLRVFLGQEGSHLWHRDYSHAHHNSNLRAPFCSL